MKKLLLIYSIFFALVHQAFAQDGDSLLLTLEDEVEEPTSLLPDKFMLTQRIFWGEKGLLRTTGIFPLTESNRIKELKIRRTALVTHQILGDATLAGMIAQGVVGQCLYSGEGQLKDLHEGLAGAVNVGYFTGAALSLFPPPPLISREVIGLNSIKAHKILASVHLRQTLRMSKKELSLKESFQFL
ncbi:hypothetical protein [Lunatibacter salilacus]|uniref:hypothetical protein n=1 Tax=Lunatibacter salilacus TaxID=2483804 RepID=UPI00131ADBDC|nr:hypothetical protein [Lunatibacter salilacus]